MALCRGWFGLTFLLLTAGAGQAQVSVPDGPPPNAKTLVFHDGHFGVRFKVPGGWSLARKDGQVSTFHLDARSAPSNAQMRGVVAIQFNPFPFSTFSGAMLYYSVAPHSTDDECTRQATRFAGMPAATPVASTDQDTQDIGGMNFAHGHDEHGKICVEARDEVYTAYRKGSCYRFDLAMNTFCSVSSGAADMTESQLEQIDQKMADILSTVKLDWEKTGPHPVPAPKVPITPVIAPGQHTASLELPAQIEARGAAQAGVSETTSARGSVSLR